MGQVGHVMPGTSSVTVFVAAQAAEDSAAMNTTVANPRFILRISTISPSSLNSIKVLGEIWVHQRKQRQRYARPKQELVQTACLRRGTNLAGLAYLCGTIDASPGKEQRPKRDGDKKWTERL